jgi:hypothetical protein
VVVHVSYVYLCPFGDVINSTLFLIHYLAHSFAMLALPTGDGCKTISLAFSPLRIATKSEPHPNHYFAQIQAEMSPPPPLPPPLMEELVAEVLVCLPPTEPASLFRATALLESTVGSFADQPSPLLPINRRLFCRSTVGDEHRR